MQNNMPTTICDYNQCMNVTLTQMYSLCFTVNMHVGKACSLTRSSLPTKNVLQTETAAAACVNSADIKLNTTNASENSPRCQLIDHSFTPSGGPHVSHTFSLITVTVSGFWFEGREGPAGPSNSWEKLKDERRGKK